MLHLDSAIAVLQASGVNALSLASKVTSIPGAIVYFPNITRDVTLASNGLQGPQGGLVEYCRQLQGKDFEALLFTLQALRDMGSKQTAESIENGVIAALMAPPQKQNAELKAKYADQLYQFFEDNELHERSDELVKEIGKNSHIWKGFTKGQAPQKSGVRDDDDGSLFRRSPPAPQPAPPIYPPPRNPSNNPPRNDYRQLDKFRFDYIKEVKQGLALIINNVEFVEKHPWNKKRGLPKRLGSDKDADDVEMVLRSHGFTFIEHRKCNKPYGINDGDQDELKRLLNDIAVQKFKNVVKNPDCFVVVVASHGKDGRFATYDGDLSIEKELISVFDNENCEYLRGIPKMFFIQACRGDDPGKGVQADSFWTPEDEIDPNFIEKVVTIPVEADVLIAFATVPGNISLRNPVTGSWFLQALCRALTLYAHQGRDIQQILTIVCNQVSEKMADCEGIYKNSKQCPMFVSRLRHLVQFVPIE